MKLFLGFWTKSDYGWGLEFVRGECGLGFKVVDFDLFLFDEFFSVEEHLVEIFLIFVYFLIFFRGLAN